MSLNVGILSNGELIPNEPVKNLLGSCSLRNLDF